MTMRQIALELKNRGHNITYVNRSDGGILITSIDGTKYTGAAGNKIARTIVGETLSKSRSTQLKIIKPSRGKRAAPIPKTLKEEVKRVQKIYNEKKVPISQGRITQRLINKIYREEGIEAAYKKLSSAEKYASGYATNVTIDALVTAIEGYKKLMDDVSSANLLEDLIVDILLNSDSIRDEWIKPAYEALYFLDKGYDPRDVVGNVRAILHI